YEVGRPFRQIVERVDLPAIDRLQGKVPPRQILNARGIVELGPFRAQRRHCVAFAADLEPQLGDALRLPRRLELDFVDVGRRQHERADHADVENAHHRGFPDPWRATMSAGDGNCGCNTVARRLAIAASVRSAARSLAERARGLAPISASSGTIGRLVRMRKVAGACAGAGRWREGALGRLRSIRKDFAMRSSSEWNATTTNRPPGL